MIELNSENIKTTGNKVIQVMTTIGWVLFGLSVVLIPLWIVFFVYLIFFAMVFAGFYFLREYVTRSIARKK
ncbi:MAG: hypothetical protein OEV66_06625 [Spirochaetia bacterium]|nr:hypothetical protein [Spirochaetia bacterium]